MLFDLLRYFFINFHWKNVYVLTQSSHNIYWLTLFTSHILLRPSRLQYVAPFAIPSAQEGIVFEIHFRKSENSDQNMKETQHGHSSGLNRDIFFYHLVSKKFISKPEKNCLAWKFEKRFSSHKYFQFYIRSAMIEIWS